MFYLMVNDSLTTNSTINLTTTYSGKSLIFFHDTKIIDSIKIYGITGMWEFVPVSYIGDYLSFKLDVTDVKDYYAYVIVPNPGYFQTSQSWFNILNNAKDVFMSGEVLA